MFALLTDRKNLTYQQLFQELKRIAVPLGRTWKPEHIMSDFETSLIPAVAAEVRSIYRLFYKLVFSFNLLKLHTKVVIFITINVFIGVSSLWVQPKPILRMNKFEGIVENNDTTSSIYLRSGNIVLKFTSNHQFHSEKTTT